MTDYGISKEMIEAILDMCRQCKEQMKRKRDDKNWKHFYVGCHVLLKLLGMYILIF